MVEVTTSSLLEFRNYSVLDKYVPVGYKIAGKWRFLRGGRSKA